MWPWRRMGYTMMETLEIWFSLLACRYLGVYVIRWTIFFINMQTWYGQSRVLEALLCRFYAHFVGRGYQWLYIEFKLSYWNKALLLRGFVMFQAFEFVFWNQGFRFKFNVCKFKSICLHYCSISSNKTIILLETYFAF